MKNQAYRMAMLYDFYGDLLTPRQKEFYDLYYNDDLSLAETLEDIEEKTGLIQRYHRTRATTAALRSLCSQLQALNQARFMDRELDDLGRQLSDAIDDLERE